MKILEKLSRVHAHNLVAFARTRPELLVLSADLTSSCEADLFRESYPERFLSLGIAEQNMLSFAAGLAREGYRPYIHTFAVFIYRRAFDQLAMSVAYSNLPVRLVGFLPGITTPGGATHQAIDDLALLRALPNLTILECGDATEVESVLAVAEAIEGPVYIRMLRGEIHRLFPKEEPMVLNRSRLLNSSGDAVTLLTSGLATEEALKITPFLRAHNIGFQHRHISTHKPFNTPERDPELTAALASARHGVITLENHTVVGGLGTATAELMAAAGAGKPLVKLGLQDQFSHGASYAYLAREHGMDAIALLSAIGRMIGTKSDLAAEYQQFLTAPTAPGPAKAFDQSKCEDL